MPTKKTSKNASKLHKGKHLESTKTLTKGAHIAAGNLVVRQASN
jgi:hypothetical protein